MLMTGLEGKLALWDRPSSQLQAAILHARNAAWGTL
jgi:hypothetical protein